MNKLNLYRELIILVLVMFGVVLLVGSAHAAHCAFSTCDNVTPYLSCDNAKLLYDTTECNVTYDNVTPVNTDTNVTPASNTTNNVTTVTIGDILKELFDKKRKELDNEHKDNITNVSIEHLQEQIKQLKDENQKLKKANTKLKQTAAKLIKQNNYLKAKNYDLKEGYSNQYKPYYKKCTALDYCNGCYPSQKIEINNY